VAVKAKNFELVTGQSLNFTIVYSGATGTAGATAPIDLTDYVATMVFSSPAGAELLALGETGATGPGIYKVAAAGYLRIGLTPSQVASLKPEASYKLFVENQNDETDTPCLARGVIKFVD
jgi:hypothetical protein